MIVVIDSGIWVSAFQFGGTPLAAIRTAFVKHRIAICDQIVQEVEAVMSRKFGWTSQDVHHILSEYLVDAVMITVTGKITGICRDTKDDMVLECALLSDAAMIVSGDQDILAIKAYEGISTVAAREFVAGG